MRGWSARLDSGKTLVATNTSTTLLGRPVEQQDAERVSQREPVRKERERADDEADERVRRGSESRKRKTKEEGEKKALRK